MADFGPLGGVKITGFISPVDTADTYAVIDPLYGVDGFRNITGDTSELNNIPELRRRAGMVVGVSGGSEYYRLKDVTWQYDATSVSGGTDWDILDFGLITPPNNKLVPLIYNDNLAEPNNSVKPAFGTHTIDSGSTYTSILGGNEHYVLLSNNSSIISGDDNEIYGLASEYVQIYDLLNTGLTTVTLTHNLNTTGITTSNIVVDDYATIVNVTGVTTIYEDVYFVSLNIVDSNSLELTYSATTSGWAIDRTRIRLENTSSSNNNSILVGSGNTINGNNKSTILGGDNNVISGTNQYESTIINGNNNIVRRSSNSVIGGGIGNVVEGDESNPLIFSTGLTVPFGVTVFNINHNLGYSLIEGYHVDISSSGGTVPLNLGKQLYPDLNFDTFTIVNSNQIQLTIQNTNLSPVDIDAITITLKLSSKNSTIISGVNNIITNSPKSFIGSGRNNKIEGGYVGSNEDYTLVGSNIIVGGYYNEITGDGSFGNFIGNGGGYTPGFQTDFGYTPPSPKKNRIVSANISFIGSGDNNFIGGGSGNGILAGTINSVGNASNNSSIIGGINNEVFGGDGSVVAGASNEIRSNNSGIIGGSGNYMNTSADQSFIGGGSNNDVRALRGAIIGGQNNQVLNTNGAVIGGNGNDVTGTNSAILAGLNNNIAGGTLNGIIGGSQNTINSGNYNVIVGGYNHTMTNSYYSTVISGLDGTLTDSYRSTIINSMDYSGYGRIVNSDTSLLVGLNTITNATQYGGNINMGGFFNTIDSSDYCMMLGGGGYNRIDTNSYHSVNIGGAPSLPNVISSSTGSTIIGNNSVINDFDYVNILGNNITAATDNQVYVQNLNIFETPTTDNTLGNILVRDTDGEVKVREVTSISAVTSGATAGGIPTKFAITTAFTADVAVTIPHNMGLAGGEEYDIIVQLRDIDNNEEVGGFVDNFQSNSVDVTFSQNYANIRIVIIG